MKNFFKKILSMININGQSISGKSITIINGKVMVDGKDYTPEGKEINIVVTGNIDKINVDACSQITVNGNVEEVHLGVGNLKCMEVIGNVEISTGDIKCEGSIGQNAKTGCGDIKCDSILGDAKTGCGDIKYKK